MRDIIAYRGIMQNGDYHDTMKPLLYRPFDIQYIVYSKQVVTRPRSDVMRNMLEGGNVGLVSARSNKSHNPDHFFCSRFLTETKCGESTTQSCLFPLYLYPASDQKGLFDTNETSDTPGGRYPNLASSFITDFSNKLNMQFVQDGKGDLQQTFGPEDIFDYMYAVFHSPTYRSRYAEFLKIDFPRLPLTSNANLFRALCKRGDRLVVLHLMEQAGKTIDMPKYPVAGNNVVEKVEYLHTQDEPESGCVSINKTQCFEGVPLEVWEFHIGGYQVCHKWLKDRKGRTLSYDDIQHYQRIVAALAETIQVMSEIDEVIVEHGGWPIE